MTTFLSADVCVLFHHGLSFSLDSEALFLCYTDMITGALSQHTDKLPLMTRRYSSVNPRSALDFNDQYVYNNSEPCRILSAARFCGIEGFVLQDERDACHANENHQNRARQARASRNLLSHQQRRGA